MTDGDELSVCYECTPVVEAQYDTDHDSGVTAAIVEALGDAAGVEPLDLPPLNEYVDTDALDAMAHRAQITSGSNIVVGFQVETWNVFVHSYGRIRVYDGTQLTEPIPVFEAAVA